MPTGVICNVLAVAAGGMIGAVGGSKMKSVFKGKLNRIFGICSIFMSSGLTFFTCSSTIIRTMNRVGLGGT